MIIKKNLKKHKFVKNLPLHETLKIFFDKYNIKKTESEVPMFVDGNWDTYLINTKSRELKDGSIESTIVFYIIEDIELFYKVFDIKFYSLIHGDDISFVIVSSSI
jgi:hypothetical protein